MMLIVSVVVLAGLGGPGHADEPAKPAEPKSYVVSCKLVRKVLVNNAEGKREVETIESQMPSLTTLEGTRAEYHSGGKVGSTPYGFQLRVKVTGAAPGKVRLEVQAEDSAAEGGGFNPLVQTHRQRVVRQVRLGKLVKLELDATKQGEGTWVELTVQEAADE
jgi:hypothetical protein